MMRFCVVVFILALLLQPFLTSASEIRVNDSSDPNGPYAIKMIQLANDHIEKKYKLVISQEPFSQSRIMTETSNGNLDIFWSSSTSDLEARYRPIRINLFKGLLGYRIFIINKNNQAKFDNIKTLADLKKITIGQGRTWADGDILERNGFTVIKTNKYESLFYMVDGNRFDAFARGVHEPFDELDRRKDLKDLVVEKNIMLSYKVPFYLFVDQKADELAKDLELGFERAIADGSFDAVFFNDPAVKKALTYANMKNRRVFELENPTLSKETPLDRKELWFDPSML